MKLLKRLLRAGDETDGEQRDDGSGRTRHVVVTTERFPPTAVSRSGREPPPHRPRRRAWPGDPRSLIPPPGGPLVVLPFAFSPFLGHTNNRYIKINNTNLILARDWLVPFQTPRRQVAPLSPYSLRRHPIERHKKSYKETIAGETREENRWRKSEQRIVSTRTSLL